MVRTLIAAALFLAFVAAITIAASRDADASGMQGDATCDLNVTIDDALRVLQRSAEVAPTPTCTYNGDTDCDQAVTANDALRTLAYLIDHPMPDIHDCFPVGTVYQVTPSLHHPRTPPSARHPA